MITNLVVMTITAYCNCTTICCPKSSKGLAANNKLPVAGVTIAAPRSLPFGTKIFIPQVGWKTVHDRLARKYDNRIDVFMSSHKKAKNFGIRKETVTIITSKL